MTWLVFLTTLAGVALLASILNSSVTRQLDPKGCRMSYMNPRYIHLSEFDTEHTRFASKYSLYLYREGGVYESPMVSRTTERVGPRYWFALVAGELIFAHRFLAYPYFSSLEMQEATSKSGLLLLKQPDTSTTCCSTIPHLQGLE